MRITSKQQSKQKLAVGAVVVSALALIAVLVTGMGRSVSATVSGETEKETPITGQALEQAKTAALKHTGQGTVSDSEVGDEESYYEVEVSLPDGRQTDVQLNEQFQVVGDKTDRESE